MSAAIKTARTLLDQPLTLADSLALMGGAVVGASLVVFIAT
jgi:hypothetical protein